MRKKYLFLLLIPLLVAFAGCGKKKTVAPPPELNPPTNLTVIVISYKQVSLSWQDNSTIEDGFRVCCDMGGNQYQIVDTLPPNSISFQHYNLQPRSKYTYTYYIQAYRGDEYGNSKEVSVKIFCPVKILNSRLNGPEPQGSDWIMRIGGQVRNNATEKCYVQLKAYSPGYPTLTGGKWATDVEAKETRDFGIRYTIGRKTKSYRVEIADVEIYY